MSHAPNAPTGRTPRPVCIACYQPNDSNLVLCAQCEAFAQQSRRRAGLPLRYAKTLTAGEEPSD